MLWILFACGTSEKELCFGEGCSDTATTPTQIDTGNGDIISCFDNGVNGTLNSTSVSVNHFVWDRSEADGIVYVVGYENPDNVDICANLEDSTPFDFPQLHITTYPDLNQLPQELNVGIMGTSDSLDIKAIVTYLDPTEFQGGQPYTGSIPVYRATSGTLVVQSVLSGGESTITELTTPTSQGDGTATGTVEGSISTAEIKACHCAGLWNFYHNL